MTDQTNTLAAFQGKNIRKTWHNNEWWFSVVDVIEALTDSKDPTDYWYRLKKRELESSEIELSTFCRQLKLLSPNNKSYEVDCANTEGLFRIIQSIPSPKAEPFKLWLAKTGYQRVQEIADPELTQQRMKELYRTKGYSDQWIEKRVRGIAIRDELTDEWKQRGVTEEKNFAILTAEISKATFDMTPAEYKELKGLKQENLRDHMNELELIFGMLGEKVSTEITKTEDAQGYPELEDAAQRGGKVAGNARKETEKELGRSITSKNNYLAEPEKKKRLK
ncbi:MAG: Bro-N domain-containing protein [Candidatus Nanoarchaeia archaeon]